MQTHRIIARLAAAAALALVAGAASATVVNFDGLPDGTLSDGYGGIDWNDNWSVYSGSQSPYNAFSGTGRIYTNYTVNTVSQYKAVSFSFASGVVFDGAYVAGASNTGGVKFEEYYDGALVYTTDTLNQTATPTFLSSGYTGLVDTVYVVGTDGFYVLDDVTYTAAAVPEPASLGMMLGGLLLTAGLARRARKH